MEMKDAYKLITKNKLINSIQIVSLLAIATIALFIVSAMGIDVYYFNWIALYCCIPFTIQLIVNLVERALFMKNEVLQNSLYDLQNNIVMDNVEGVLTSNCYYSMKKPLKPIPLENVVWMYKDVVRRRSLVFLKMVLYMNDNTAMEMTYRLTNRMGVTNYDNEAALIMTTVQAKNPNVLLGYEDATQKLFKKLKKNNYDYVQTFYNMNQ
ncbi:MAG: hypothetical protein J6J16_04070 [Lachnospiraceae bacterium]|nr:hypothetical protein [Lachnospiraceae bacterium]